MQAIQSWFFPQGEATCQSKAICFKESTEVLKKHIDNLSQLVGSLYSGSTYSEVQSAYIRDKQAAEYFLKNIHQLQKQDTSGYTKNEHRIEHYAQLLSIYVKKIELVGKIEQRFSDEKIVKTLREATFVAPDCIQFLFDTALIYQMIAYSDAFDAECIKITDSYVHLCVENQWMAWNDVEQRIAYDSSTGQFFDKINPHISWTYISSGFIKNDRTKFQKLYPIGQLSDEKYQNLLQRAQAYDVEKSKDQTAILQFFTTERRFSLPKNCLTENLYNNLPCHVGFRLISENRDVYSFGFEVDKQQLKELEPKGIAKHFTRFTTVDAHVSVLDYEETRSFDQRRVTTLPISQETLQSVVDMISQRNKGELHEQAPRFSYAGYNCTAFAKDVLQAAKHPIDTRTSLDEALYRMLPSWENIPYVNYGIRWLAHKTNQYVLPILQKITDATPLVIKNEVKTITVALTNVVRKVWVVLKNIYMFMGGVYRMTPSSGTDKKNSEIVLPRFKRILQSPWDIFDEKLSVGHHSLKIVDWQNQHKNITTTYSYKSGQPRLYGLCVEDEEKLCK